MAEALQGSPTILESSIRCKNIGASHDERASSRYGGVVGESAQVAAFHGHRRLSEAGHREVADQCNNLWAYAFPLAAYPCEFAQGDCCSSSGESVRHDL